MPPKRIGKVQLGINVEYTLLFGFYGMKNVAW